MVASTNVTVDDSSSLILYDPPDAWSSPSGKDAQTYANATVHETVVNGASAKFTFNGTGAWFYGAKRPDYGSFVFVVDDEISGYLNSTSSEAALGQLLAGVSDLQMGQHVVMIMNGGTGPIDLDSIVYETVGRQQPKIVAHATTGRVAGGGESPSSQSFASSVSTQAAADANADLDPGTEDSDTNASPSTSTDPAATTTPVDGPSSVATDADSQSTAQSTLLDPVLPSPNIVAPSLSDPSAPPNATANGLEPTGQAERVSNSPIAGTSKAHRGLPMGAIIGIVIGCVMLILVIVALFLMFLRRGRRVKARRRKTALASSVLPLQDPDTEFGYFFRGQGAMAEDRNEYFRHSAQSRMSQMSGDTLRGYGGPYKEKDVTEMPTPLPPVLVRDSSYTSETSTLNGDRVDEASDITDMYARMDPGGPIRPPRPPELRLSV
ncbi:hypothetical protein BV20DRAFT_1053044 [Pilatotrama ljubarskyi]|nr:hypothetical protein BV20DRAFT_1053044 [Pilatotrama ljubarskyi]